MTPGASALLETMNLHRWKTLSSQFSAQLSQQASEQAGINEENARSLEAIDLRLERLERLVGSLVESGLRVAPQDRMPQFGTRSAAPAKDPAATEKPAAAEEPAATEQPTEPEPAALPPPPLRPPFVCCLAQVSCGATGNSETLCDALSDLFYATEGAAQSCAVAAGLTLRSGPPRILLGKDRWVARSRGGQTHRLLQLRGNFLRRQRCGCSVRPH